MDIIITKNSDITITVSLLPNTFHEISQIDVVFGKVIQIMYNSSYKSGFGTKRTEETKIIRVNKHPKLHPAVLCLDVLLSLSNLKNIEGEAEDLLSLITTTVKQHNRHD